MRKVTVLVLSCSVLMGMMTSCAGGKIPSGDSKTIVTMANFSSTDFAELEKLVENTYIDIDLEPGYISPDSYTKEAEERLQTNTATDLLVVNQISEDSMVEYMLDLSGYAFCAEYDKGIMDNLSIDGRIYVVPMTGFYHGYQYNKTLFMQNNIALPTTIQQLKQAVIDLTTAGIDNGYGTSFGVELDVMHALGRFVVGTAVPDYLSTVKGITWEADFIGKTARFTGSWEAHFGHLFELVDMGIINPDMLDRTRAQPDVLSGMARGKLGVAFYPELCLERLVEANETAYELGEVAEKYEYGMLPFLSSNGREPWVITTPECYIGINKSLQSEGNGAKLSACERILDLISTSAGQSAVAKALHGNISYLRGCDLSEFGVPSGLEQVVEDGRVYPVKFAGKMLDEIGQLFCEMMQGRISLSEYAAKLDWYYYNEGAS